MGLFDFFRSKKTAVSPEELREALFKAIQAANWQELADLCKKHYDVIVREFSGWKTAPKAIRDDPAAIQQFCYCIGTLAEFLVRIRGEPDVMQKLIGPEEANPLIEWQQKLQQAEGWMKELRFEDVITLLTELLNKVRGLRDVNGNVVATNLPRTYGHLGYCHLQAGQADRAIEPFTEALALCEQHGDAEGIVAYLGNLFEAHRYLGQSESAAAYSERLAEAFAKRQHEVAAVWWRKQTAIVRAGEPLVRMIAEVNGQSYELDELTIPVGAQVNFIYHRNRIHLVRALHLISQGEQFWHGGQGEEAISAFLAAAKADPFDPQPCYQMGACLLYAGLYSEAVKYYEKTEGLAPGWFFCRRYLWLAQQLAKGRYDHDTFLTLQALDDGRQDRTPEEKTTLAREALAKTPDLPWLYLALGRYLKALKLDQEAETAIRGGLEHEGDVEVHCCLLLELALGQAMGSPEQVRLLEEICSRNGSLMASAFAGVMLKRDQVTQP